jgi:tight adherence protein B
MQTLALAFLAATAIGGIAWVFLYPMLSGERQAEKRRASVARPETARIVAERNSQRSRRTQVEQTLKEIEDRAKEKRRLSIANRIQQAGLTWSKTTFIIISASLGVMLFLVVLIVSGSLLASVAFGFAAGFGIPRWLLSHLRKRREKKFLEGLPDAIDVIVRGIKAGLPLFDSIKIVATDAPEPLRSEFATIVETQAIGMPLGEACERLYERMPLPEANFFGIVIAIQQKAGGNLSEALGNLSKVLRERKKMKAKIKALSTEAKAGAVVIGSMPVVVMVLVYLTTPKYIEVLWLDPTGRILLAGSAILMTMGILVMKKMINFDF